MCAKFCFPQIFKNRRKLCKNGVFPHTLNSVERCSFKARVMKNHFSSDAQGVRKRLIALIISYIKKQNVTSGNSERVLTTNWWQSVLIGLTVVAKLIHILKKLEYYIFLYKTSVNVITEWLMIHGTLEIRFSFSIWKKFF